MAAPFINLIACSFVALRVGALYTLVVLGFWVGLMIIQNCVGNKVKKLKGIEAKYNDERLKVINDLVIGCRTIKCYGWETYYRDMAKKVRKDHTKLISWILTLQQLGTSFFQNTGLLVVFVLMLPEWLAEKPLRTSEILAILSVVYTVFFQVNILTYLGIFNYKNFQTILERLASIFKMEEFVTKRVKQVTNDQVIAEVIEGSFSWGFRVKEEQKLARGQVDIEETENPIIENINFSMKKGELMIVVGKVGSGKTTLLHSLMEETKKMKG